MTIFKLKHQCKFDIISWSIDRAEDKRMKFFEHLRTINHHKFLVMKHCFRCGLYKQGLLHDMSKYSWTEFSRGVKYYQGYRSPNIAEREVTGVTMSWLHHKGRNKHHIEYWIDYSPIPGEGIVGMEMPVHYVCEMFCDRVAASKTYNKEKYTDHEPLRYYQKERKHYIIHPNTDRLIVSLLEMLSEKGEDATFRYIREVLLKTRKK